MIECCSSGHRQQAASELYGIIRPEKPRRHRSPRRPASASRQASLRSAAPETECRSHRVLQRHVAGGKDIGMTAAEHQIDLRRPRPDALQRRQRGQRLGRRQPTVQKDRARLKRRPRRSASASRPSPATGRTPARPRMQRGIDPSAVNSTSPGRIRRQIASALARDTICETMICASPSKPGSRSLSGSTPASAAISTRRGSSSSSCSSP
jgi:hypothetical protein